jgi:hypothetical protein
VKTTEIEGERGYDAGKQVKGRKRHLLVDTLVEPEKRQKRRVGGGYSSNRMG